MERKWKVPHYNKAHLGAIAGNKGIQCGEAQLLLQDGDYIVVLYGLCRHYVGIGPKP